MEGEKREKEHAKPKGTVDVSETIYILYVTTTV